MLEPGPPLAVQMVAYGEQFAGAERQILTLSAGLIRRGIEVRAHLRFDRDLASRLRALGMEVEASAAGSLPRQAEMIAARIDAHVPTVIHAHNVRSSVVAAIAAARTRTPVLKTEHGSPSPPSAPVRRLSKEALARLAETTALRTTNARIVFVSRDLQLAARWARRLHQHVILNGVECPAETPARPAELSPGAFNVVFAGRLEPVKGPLTAIAAIARLPRDARIRLTIIGDGPLRAQVEAAVREPALRDRVSFLGFRSDALGFVAHADALLMPSVHEGLPFAALEALALRTPLVASRVGGLAEVLQHDSTALLVEPAEPAAFCEALLRLESSPDLGARLRDSGARLVRERLSADAMVEAYLDAYRRSVNTVSASRR